MHIKIQGGGDGVYANTGSCAAAAMYCEHERQKLIKEGKKPQTFFHQSENFVSIHEVIDRIDNNKKKLSKVDAKFFVMTVSPSKEEQLKMGEELEDRITTFKNYIRNGVMAQYAENFGRGLSANDIMYYAYIHVERGDKTSEQMHAHIIVSRRDKTNSISLSPKSNHRSKMGVIAHGFNRNLFFANCERTFDYMMSFERTIDNSYKYFNTIKNGTYSDLASLATKNIEKEYGVDLSAWDNLVAESQKTTTQTKTPEHNYLDGIISTAKKAWNFAVDLLSHKEEKSETTINPIKEEPNNQTDESELKSEGKNMTAVDVFEKNGHYILAMMKKGKLIHNNIELTDAKMFFEAKNGNNKKEFNKICAALEDKYLKDILAQNTVRNGQHERKKTAHGLVVFKTKDNYSCAIFNNGKRCSQIVQIDRKDAEEYFKSKKTGNQEYMKKVFSDISAKYFYGKLAQQVADEFMRKNIEDNITSTRVQRGNTGYCSVRYKINNEWRPRYKISDELSCQINSLPEEEIPVLLGIINNVLADGLSISAASGCGLSQPKNDDDKKKKKKGIGR